MDRESIQERFGIVGRSPALKHVIDRVRQVARTDISVLIEGESGAGKELMADALHHLSARRHEPMIVVNCGAIPEGLIESELFGAEKGAYTGATAQRTGYFEEADGGTIFLDEIGEMPQAAQVRLLRVLESGQYSRVGSSTARQADVRVLAATNKDLAREVEAGRFREDLYYRLSTVLIRVPPLRERAEDVLPLFDHFMHRFAQKYNSPRKRLTEDARQLLRRYHWPGNARELRNVAEQCVVLLRAEEVAAEDVQPFLRGVSASGSQERLLPVLRRDRPPEAPDETRERELLYRAILDLQREIRDMRDEFREQLQSLASKDISITVPRELAERGARAAGANDGGRGGDASLIEDVVYEIADDPHVDESNVENRHVGEAHGDSPRGETAQAYDAPGEDEASEAAAETSSAEAERIRTLEEAERALIAQALRRFDGNRRQTAQALGISERTLYRKLKDLDEDL